MDQRIKDIQALAESKGLELSGYDEKIYVEDEIKVKRYTLQLKETLK